MSRWYVSRTNPYGNGPGLTFGQLAGSKDIEYWWVPVNDQNYYHSAATYYPNHWAPISNLYFYLKFTAKGGRTS